MKKNSWMSYSSAAVNAHEIAPGIALATNGGSAIVELPQAVVQVLIEVPPSLRLVVDHARS